MLDRLRELLTLAERLTWEKVIIWSAATLAGIALFGIWEERSTRIPQMMQSTMAVGVISASVVLGLFGAVGSYLFRRVEAKNDELQSYLRDQILQLRRALDDLDVREETCRDELRALRIRMGRAEATIREAGLPWASTS